MENKKLMIKIGKEKRMYKGSSRKSSCGKILGFEDQTFVGNKTVVEWESEQCRQKGLYRQDGFSPVGKSRERREPTKRKSFAVYPIRRWRELVGGE